MGEANSVVGQLQIREEPQLAASPDGAIAVLVGGVVVDDGLPSAGRVSGIGEGM